MSRCSRTFRLAGALFAAAWLVAPVTAAQQPAAPARRAATTSVTPTKGPTVEGITQYDLSNGLRVLLIPDSSKPTTTVNITYLVGSRMEGYGETGMAHLLEHMVFKGSPRHRDIPQELTAHGARPNGTTWFDRTNYFETFESSDSNLVWALDLEADRMVNSFIAKKDLETEFTVVRNEYELGENDPSGVLLDRTLATAYLWHNYGKSTIGARSDIEDVPIGRLQAFYHKYYQPDNAVLVVAGKFNIARTLSLVQQKFGAIPRPDRSGAMKIYSTYTVEPTQDGERAVTLRRVGDVQVVDAVYHVPAGSDSDFAAVEVLERVLGDAPSGRLYKALVETKKAASVNAFAFQLREPGVLVLTAQVRKEDSLDSARVAMLRTADSVLATPPSAEEVARAKQALLKNIELNLNNSERVGLTLSEWIAMGDWRMEFLYRDRVKQVTPEAVARVARAYLKPSNLTVGVFIPTAQPDRSTIPPVPDVAAVVKDYKGDTARVAGEAFDPSPANIDGRTTRTTLPNGLKVALLAKRTRGQTVNATITLRFGSLPAVMGQSAVGDLTADMLLRGTTSLTRQQIKDSLDKLEARVGIFGGPTSVRVSIETTRPHLAAVLSLVSDVLRHPAFDQKEFDALRQENLASLEEQGSEPTALGSIAFQQYLNPFPKDDPRHASSIDESVAEYTAAADSAGRAFYTRFYGASNGEVAIVGDFDGDPTAKLLTDLFGTWKSPAPFERIPQVYQARPDTTIVIETPDKANAFFLAGMNLPLRDDDPDYAALLLGNYMLGGGFLNSRLATRIRQREGISYGVGSQIGAGSLDKSGVFVTYAIYAPENVVRLEQAFREEVARVLKDGFTGTEVQQAKAGWLQSQQVSRSQDRSLASMLANDLYLGRTLGFDANLEKAVAALTPAQILAAMQRWIVPAQITIVKAGDFAKHPPVAAPPANH
jgi:zinc protease